MIRGVKFVTVPVTDQDGVEFVQEPQKAGWGTAVVFRDVGGNAFVPSSK